MSGWHRPDQDPFVDLSDEAAHDAAVRSWTEVRDRTARASRTATWIGTLRDLAERELEVSVTTASGRRHRGALVGIATDHLALRGGGARRVLVALQAVRVVRPEPGGRLGEMTGHRSPPVDQTLADALDRCAEENLAVTVVLDGVTEPLQGYPVSIGEDVLTLRLTAGEPARVLLPVAAVVEVIFDA